MYSDINIRILWWTGHMCHQFHGVTTTKCERFTNITITYMRKCCYLIVQIIASQIKTTVGRHLAIRQVGSPSELSKPLWPNIAAIAIGQNIPYFSQGLWIYKWTESLLHLFTEELREQNICDSLIFLSFFQSYSTLL